MQDLRGDEQHDGKVQDLRHLLRLSERVRSSIGKYPDAVFSQILVSELKKNTFFFHYKKHYFI